MMTTPTPSPVIGSSGAPVMPSHGVTRSAVPVGATTGTADRVTPWDGITGAPEEPITGDGVGVVIIGTPGDCVDVTVAIRVFGAPVRRFPRFPFRLAHA